MSIGLHGTAGLSNAHVPVGPNATPTGSRAASMAVTAMPGLTTPAARGLPCASTSSGALDINALIKAANSLKTPRTLHARQRV